ncbi:hypothetical protein BD770DRAFT_394056 [Pilaira anomala]|nr:hypothetical protein BD770DRAFT_394056 [Pilaira anomala]
MNCVVEIEEGCCIDWRTSEWLLAFCIFWRLYIDFASQSYGMFPYRYILDISCFPIVLLMFPGNLITDQD